MFVKVNVFDGKTVRIKKPKKHPRWYRPHIGPNRWILFPTRKPFAAGTEATIESQLPGPVTHMSGVEEEKTSCDCASAFC